MCTFNIQKLCTLFENLCFLNIQNCLYCLSKKKIVYIDCTELCTFFKKLCTLNI